MAQAAEGNGARTGRRGDPCIMVIFGASGDFQRIGPPHIALFEKFPGYKLEACVETRNDAGIGAVRIDL